MRKFIQKKLKEQKGMTLIELLAVIVILAIIAAIAIPAIGNIIENSRVGAIKSDAQNIISAGELYFIDNTDETEVTLKTLVDDNFVEDKGSFEGADDTKVNVFKSVSATGSTAAVPTKFTGTGKDGKIQVRFVNATKDAISKYANSDRGSVTGATGVNAGPAS